MLPVLCHPAFQHIAPPWKQRARPRRQRAHMTRQNLEAHRIGPRTVLVPSWAFWRLSSPADGSPIQCARCASLTLDTARKQPRQIMNTKRTSRQNETRKSNCVRRPAVSSWACRRRIQAGLALLGACVGIAFLSGCASPRERGRFDLRSYEVNGLDQLAGYNTD